MEQARDIATQPYLPGMESEQRRRDLSQFFTPAALATRVWRWMLPPSHPRSLRVLEPSAGDGALIRPLNTLGIQVQHLVAYEVDPRHVQTLAQLVAIMGLPAVIRAADFTADPDPSRFDICVMNPPYERGQEITFAERALGCSTFVGGVFRSAILFGQGRHEFWRWTDIRRGVYLSERPCFGGDDDPKADFVVLELMRRQRARLQGEPSTINWEWWML